MWIEIFKVGNHTDSQGKNHSYTVEDLEQIANQYNEKIKSETNSQAPIVLGHPKSSEPALGWVEQLARRGKFLLAKISNLSSELAQDIKNKKFSKVSISITSDLDLRHIGLLGAATPAVKGLQAVEFENTFSDIHFIDSNSEIENFPDEVNVIESFEIDKLTEENKLLKEKIKQFEQVQNERQFEDYLNQLEKNGKINSINKNKYNEALKKMKNIDELTENKFGLTQFLMNFISNVNSALITQEFATKDQAINYAFQNNSNNPKFNPQRNELHNRATQLIQQDNSLTYEQALAKCFENNYL
jgi:hypothetical protein